MYHADSGMGSWTQGLKLRSPRALSLSHEPEPCVTIDVAIVGAGPAGAWAAYTLARARRARGDLRSLASAREAVRRRRHRPRAGARRRRSSRRALPACRIQSGAIRRLGDGPLGDRPARAQRRRLTPDVAARREPRRRSTGAARRRTPRGRDAARPRASSTSASTSARSASRRPRGPLRARFLIGADGANSLVRRRLARPFRRDELSIATGFFAHGVTSDEIVIEMIADPPGYIWSFPRPTHLAIGICAQADAGIASSGAARADRRLDPRDADRRRRPARAVLVADSVAECGAVSGRLELGRAAVVRRRRRRGSGRSDHARRHLLRAAVGRSGPPTPSLADRPRALRRRVSATRSSRSSRARRGSRRDFFGRVDGPADRGASTQRRGRRGDGRSHRGPQDYAGLKWRLARTLEWRLGVAGAASAREVTVAGADADVGPRHRDLNRPPLGGRLPDSAGRGRVGV